MLNIKRAAARLCFTVAAVSSMVLGSTMALLIGASASPSARTSVQSSSSATVHLAAHEKSCVIYLPWSVSAYLYCVYG